MYLTRGIGIPTLRGVYGAWSLSTPHIIGFPYCWCHGGPHLAQAGTPGGLYSCLTIVARQAADKSQLTEPWHHLSRRKQLCRGLWPSRVCISFVSSLRHIWIIVAACQVLDWCFKSRTTQSSGTFYSVYSLSSGSKTRQSSLQLLWFLCVWLV